MGVLRKLLDRGIVVASVGYRLIKTAWSTVYDSVVDCKDAARYLIKHSNKYSLDPNNYGIWGSSAGGHLALMTALSPKSDFPTTDPLLSVYTPNFRFANAYCPVTSMIDMNIHAGTGFADTGRYTKMLGGDFEDNLDLARLLSPTTHVSSTSPPIQHPR